MPDLHGRMIGAAGQRRRTVGAGDRAGLRRGIHILLVFSGVSDIRLL